MAFFLDNAGVIQHVDNLTPDVHKAAHDAGISVAAHINKMYPTADSSRGSAFRQLCMSEGLSLPQANDIGLRPAVMGDILEGKSTLAASPSNNGDRGSPFGTTAARILFPVAVLDMVETILARDRETDGVIFSQLVGQELSVAGENLIQPVVDYQTTGGPEQVKPMRVAEFGEVASMLRIGTSERTRSLPTFGMGIEFSDKAQKALTIDVIALTIARYLAVEKDNRIYAYLSALFSGDSDLIIGAVSAVTSNSLDSAATGGVLTHKAWVKFLARFRKYRRVTHIICDIDTYLKIEGRTGRPGSNNYDPTLSRIDPQARPMSQANIGFGNDVQYFIVDSAAEGGPVPANTVWAIDASKAITRVTNSAAAYAASEAFALRRTTAMRWDYSEAVYRTNGDTELRPFDVLTIS